MINAKKKFPQRDSYELLLMDLHEILILDADNKYIRSFLGVEECVKLSIHASKPAQQLIHQGYLVKILA